MPRAVPCVGARALAAHPPRRTYPLTRPQPPAATPSAPADAATREGGRAKLRRLPHAAVQLFVADVAGAGQAALRGVQRVSPRRHGK